VGYSDNHRKIVQAIKRVFRSSDGEILQKELERICRFRVRLTGHNAPDPNEVMLNEGRRQVYIELLNLMERTYE